MSVLTEIVCRFFLYEIDMDGIIIVQAYFILLTSGLLIARTIPVTKQWIFYGKTLDLKNRQVFCRYSILDQMVPKKWFTHFYIVSVISSCFWIIQIYICRFYNICTCIAYFSNDKVQPLYEVYLCVLFMSIHGARRLYECIFIQRHSNSQMWIGHYFLGMTYYLFSGLAMWCEGGGNLQNPGNETLYSVNNVFRIIIVVFSVLIYVFSSWMQYLTHNDLSKLRSEFNAPKYSLPTSGLFKYIICPHYTSEIGIYFSLVLATRGQNKTIFLIFIWVIVILTISASETRHWRLKTFGVNAPYPPWTIIPVPVITTNDKETNVIPDRNWRSTLTAAEQHAIISHLVSALRMVSSNVSLEHLVSIVNAFEKHAYEKASSKAEYINICNSKLMHIKGSALLKQRSLQTPNRQSSIPFFQQTPRQVSVSGQLKTYEQSQTPGIMSQNTFSRSASKASQQSMDSQPQFQQTMQHLNPQMRFQQKQMLMRQVSTDPHISNQNLMQTLNCSMDQQVRAVNPISDSLKCQSHPISQQIPDQLRVQNNSQQLPQYMAHQTHVSQSSDKHSQPFDQQKMHMLTQADVYQHRADGFPHNLSNMNLQTLLAMNQAIQTQKQNKQSSPLQTQVNQLSSNQVLQGILSQMQAPLQQSINSQTQKRAPQTTGLSTSHQEFKKCYDPHLNPCNYLIPQRILAQLPELPFNVSTWTQVAELFRNQRLTPEQMTRVHELFYQHALYLQSYYQQIQQISNQPANHFQSQSTFQSHFLNPDLQIQQQQIRQIPVQQIQKASKGIPSSEFIQPEWSSEISNFSTSYLHGFSPNVNVPLNSQTSPQSQFQPIDQLSTMMQNDSTFGLKKRLRVPIKVKNNDIKSFKEQQSVLQTSNMASSSIPTQTPHISRIHQDFSSQNQIDSSIVQKILMCGGKEANMQMIARLKQIQSEVEKNGVKSTPLNDLTSAQKQQVCELVADMNQMCHRIDMLLPLFMALSWNEPAIKQLLQMRLIYKNQFDVLPLGIYLCYPSQLIKIKKLISEYFKYVKVNIYAIQKQMENGNSFQGKMLMNLSGVGPNIADSQHPLVDAIPVQMSNETLSSKLFKTDLKDNVKAEDLGIVSTKENRPNINSGFSEINAQFKENNIEKSSQKINLQDFDLSKESFNSQEKDKVIEDSLDYTLLGVTTVLEADDVNAIFSIDKPFFFSEKESIDILSNKFDSEIISSLVTEIPPSLVTNITSSQSSGKAQNNSMTGSTIEDDELSSDLTTNSLESEKIFFSSFETMFSSVISDILETEKILNHVNFEQYFDLTFNNEFRENNLSNLDKLQGNSVGSVFDINEINRENGFDEGLRLDFGGVCNIGPFKINDFYASNNENIWNEELKTSDLSTLGIGIIANVY
ncbi:hypothetical protein PCANB_002897 [Pneumocystis canis]|nr:hypothetical protein PCANB_002897 [Pneumocystis canis]